MASYIMSNSLNQSNYNYDKNLKLGSLVDDYCDRVLGIIVMFTGSRIVKHLELSIDKEMKSFNEIEYSLVDSKLNVAIPSPLILHMELEQINLLHIYNCLNDVVESHFGLVN